MHKTSRLFTVLLLTMNLAAACSTQQTVTTRSVQTDSRTGAPVTVETTTTTTESSGAGAAVWSGTLSLMGAMILLPVRAVGILIDAIL